MGNLLVLLGSAKAFSVVENRGGREKFCADIVGNVHWLGGEAAEPGSVPSAVTGLWDQVSRGVSWQPELPAIPFAGREGACSCCLPGSNKEAPERKSALAGISLDKCKGSRGVTSCKKQSKQGMCLFFWHPTQTAGVQSSSVPSLPAMAAAAMSLATAQGVFEWSFF